MSSLIKQWACSCCCPSMGHIWISFWLHCAPSCKVWVSLEHLYFSPIDFTLPFDPPKLPIHYSNRLLPLGLFCWITTSYFGLVTFFLLHLDSTQLILTSPKSSFHIVYWIAANHICLPLCLPWKSLYLKVKRTNTKRAPQWGNNPMEGETNIDALWRTLWCGIGNENGNER